MIVPHFLLLNKFTQLTSVSKYKCAFKIQIKTTIVYYVLSFKTLLPNDNDNHCSLLNVTREKTSLWRFCRTLMRQSSIGNFLLLVLVNETPDKVFNFYRSAIINCIATCLLPLIHCLVKMISLFARVMDRREYERLSDTYWNLMQF